MDLFEKLRSISWTSIVKSLSMPGGASSTKWVYLGSALVVNGCLIAMVASLCAVYIRSANHEVNIALVTLIGSTITIVVSIPANSANKRRELYTNASNQNPSEQPGEVK